MFSFHSGIPAAATFLPYPVHPVKNRVFREPLWANFLIKTKDGEL
jgi:hypothetical protein